MWSYLIKYVVDNQKKITRNPPNFYISKKNHPCNTPLEETGEGKSALVKIDTKNFVI